ncbi:MAG: heme ABC exporter ATP-binding protein CcmA [Hyphomonadaceae bacterium]|jgi:heme exporter protein A|nr:heme ABC exporter ATP-binding protein CcmA [Hyphomonadaceae bacterium]
MKLIGDKLSAVRGGRRLFLELSLGLAAGEALVVMGPNGAGKTTLLRIIAGLAPPTAGRVWLEGGAPDHAVSEQCHYVGHANAVKAGLTVAENANFWRRFLGGVRAETDTALETLGLSGLRDIPAGYLSAGQKRRLGLARLLLAERPLWLLDEPTTSLDSGAQETLTSVVNGHLARGGMVMAATHAPLGFVKSRELFLDGTAQAA